MGNRSLDDFLGGDESVDSEEAQPGNEPSDDESGDADAKPSDREQSVETDDGDDDPATDDGEDSAVTDDGDQTPESGDETDDTAGDSEDSPHVDPDGVEPAETTYVWNGEGSVCDGCGERSERRWRQSDGLVCPDCKEW